MVKTLIQEMGTSVVIGLQGDNQQEIEEQFNLFFNFGAVENGYLHYLRDEPPYFAMFWTNPDDLLRCCYNICEMRFARKTGYEFEGVSHRKRLMAQAQTMIDGFEQDQFIYIDNSEKYQYALSSELQEI